MSLPLMSSAGYRRKPDADWHPTELKTLRERQRADELVDRYGDVFFIEDFGTDTDAVVLYADILQMDEGEFKAMQYWVKTGDILRPERTVSRAEAPLPFLQHAAHTLPVRAMQVPPIEEVV